MRSMMEGLEGRTMFAATAVASSALPASITPSVPVSIAGKTILPNQVFKGSLKLKDGGVGGETDLPLTVAFASANGFSYTATMSITAKKLNGTQVVSAAAPTDVFIKNKKLSNTLNAFTEGNGTVNILFDNFIHPKLANGKFEGIEELKGGLKGTLSDDGKTLTGTFMLTIKGNKSHVRTGTFSVKVG